MTWVSAAVGLLLILVMASVLATNTPAVGRRVLGIALTASNGLALVVCLLRGRRFPEEAKAWRLLAASLALAVLFNVLFALRPLPDHLDYRDALIVVLQILAATAQISGFLSLPLDTEHSHTTRVHLLGALMFGSSLALLLWILGAWQAAGPAARPDQILLLSICVRVALTGGVVIYLLAVDPRRLRGPLAWILASVLFGGGSGVLALRPIALDPMSPIPVFAALVFMNPIGMALAALHPSPADVAKGAPLRASSFIDALLYLPYLAAAACLLIAMTSAAHALVVPMIGFLAVTTLLVVHQFSLLREVRQSRDHLEERVQERTRALEEAQALMLRTERMNSLALLGAGLAHDLNNALTAITSSVAFIRESMGREEGVEEQDLARIEAASHHSAALSQRLMAFARKEAEVEERHDLARLVEEDRELLRMLLPARIHLDVQVGTGPFPLTASRGQLQQALVNLVANARDAIAGAGSVRIDLVRVGSEDGRDCAALEVADSGSGMPPEVMEKLFQPLFTTKEPGKGTGLGLASVKAIVERLGGTVSVRSAPGAGTTFCLSLPLEA